MDFEDLPEGWQVWSDEPTTVVLTYRPDVFDSNAFPAACLPTIYVTKGRRGRRPGRHTPDPDAAWYVTLFLEPDVQGAQQSYETEAAALSGATELADSFADGDVDYRSLYQVPREEYLEELDALTGR